MRRLLFVPFVLLISIISTYAQSIKAKITDDAGKGLEKASYTILRAKDSSVVKLGVAGDGGAFTVPVANGSYIIQASYVSFLSKYSAVVNVSEAKTYDAGTIVLQKEATAMTDVVVTVRKPLVEVKADKMIVNVEGTINAVGNDGLELLRRSPGVMVDKDDNLSLAGKNGVRVYIDGRPSPLSGSDLSNYLKTLQSSQIEAIEIITNPSAKYDAAGNAGIINIRLKKDKSLGTNGSLNLGYTQGFYPKYNGGISLNNRNKKVNLFGSYTYNNSKNRGIMDGDRIQFDTLFTSANVNRFDVKTHNFKAGADYFINSKNTIGVVVNGNLPDLDIVNGGDMDFYYTPTNTLVKILRSSTENKMKRNNLNGNINYRYAVPGGKDLNIDLDYGKFNNTSDQFQPNTYLLPNGTVTSQRNYNMYSESDINLFAVKADYEQNLYGGRLGAGFKIGNVISNNDFKSYNLLGSSKILDTAKSNDFKYDENINALYVNYNKSLKSGIMLQLGVRAEQTNITGTSNGYIKQGVTWKTYDSTFTRSYIDFFPSAAVSFVKNPANQWIFSYSRRIDRPAYQDLNPFEFRLNEYTYMKGNTMLRPQYTNSVSLTNIYKYRFTTSLSYSYVKDIFAQLPDTVDRSKGFLIKENLATQNVISLNFSMPLQYKKLSTFFSLTSNYSLYKADFGGGDRVVNQDAFSVVLVNQSSYKLNNFWTTELTAFYVSPSIWQGMFRSAALGNVDFGVSRTLFKGKGNLKAVFNDAFRTMRWKGDADFSGVKSTFSGNGEMQQLKLNFTYRFGNAQVKAARQRKTATEDEIKRAEQDGGNQQRGR